MAVRLSRLIFFIIVLVFIFQTITTALDFRQKSTKIKIEQEEIEKLKVKEKSLRQMLITVKSRFFIENEARNKLNMCLPGETIVIGE